MLESCLFCLVLALADSIVSDQIKKLSEVLTNDEFTGVTVKNKEFDFDVERGNRVRLTEKNGYFRYQECDLLLDERDIPDNTIFYINQAYSCSECGKEVLRYIFVLGQIVPFLNQPADPSEYDMKENHVKFLVPEHDANGDVFMLQKCVAYLAEKRPKKLILFA